MTNNDIMRRVRYAFDLDDQQMIEVFAAADKDVTRSQVSNWLKKDTELDFCVLYDIDLAIFLNGFINQKRGKRDGEQPKPEKKLTNNIVLRKLKIALNLKDDGMLELLALSGVKISKHELSAFFRKPGQNQYRECKDQVLRNFLMGMQMRYRKNK
ncbi:DUF1456 family protein [Puteibacter caeruleilacunae]|nr:DUF1456 family protein [Puteibacter caeruleilacunae]